ncbi:MAG TPA: ATP-dependent DNA helicase RecG [Candidatus Scatomonas pullistercoris]|uniref:ATP-dependent DNA helicase RecG n=1 Tax=Candidatus Scatomonas pullistercoris TaxID=2840920 RepID=A0A9D1P3Q8_9FIRM|nr:ATP-dependent DNA helicase RecG [Candidatus Scatomonas pullistercoris]
MREESLKTLKGIGDKTERLFQKAGICNLNQLLHYYPRDYDHYAEPVACGAVRAHEKNAVTGCVVLPPEVKSGKHAMTILHLRDETGSLQVNWFHMPFLRSVLKRGSVYVFRGMVSEKQGRKILEQPEIFTPAQYEKLRGKLQPVYALTAGLTSRMVGKAVGQLLEKKELEQEFLPEDIREEYGLCEINYALENIHFPGSGEALKRARNRLAFDEFFLFLLGLFRLREQTGSESNMYPMQAVWKTEDIIENLPFQLTGGQMRVWNEIERDLKGHTRMNRLIQGDVGSGKTILAFLAMVMAKENGYQSALMAPTEVLAAQHFETIRRLLEENRIFDAEPVLLTGSCTAAEKRKIYEKTASGEAKIIVGTHALIQEKVEYARLALVITDEQHRFGVRQRMRLKGKGFEPHVMVMSATPIPRTLAMILYGDLDISVLDELPKKRLPIKNCVVDPSYRPRAYRFMQREIQNGHQIYVICPLVEESQELACEDVISCSRRLREIFPEDVQIGVLYGQMKPQEKTAVMEAFAGNQIQILVSTTVVEVGVDVPNATVILVENAERFGLAQLHQLRGRVGRGDAQSYCIFIQGDGKEETSKRLQILNHSNDGFYIAEEDLKLRGPGDLFGVRQSGLAEFKIADIYRDAELLKAASRAARDLTELDPDLSLPQNCSLKVRLDAYMERQIDDIGL